MKKEGLGSMENREHGKTGSLVLRNRRFNGVKVFAATMVAQRETLGETVTTWMTARPNLELTEFVVTQSSDASFHCIAITVFYWEHMSAR